MRRRIESRLQMRRELDFGIWIGRRATKRRDLNIMEMDIRGGVRIPTVHALLGLTIVGGGADIADRDVIGEDEPGKLEELVEMALCWKGHHDYNNLCLFCYAMTWLVLLSVCHSHRIEDRICLEWRALNIRFYEIGRAHV